MSQKFIITESDKKHILNMYGIILEQGMALKPEQSFYASTSKEKMENFKNKNNAGNSDFGLSGDPKTQENYFFISTFGDILSRSKGSPEQFLSGFKPYKNMGSYLDYLKIGDVEISGSGEQTFSNLNKGTSIIASHNGLLAIARLMKELKYYKPIEGTTMTIGLGQTQRETKRFYFDANLMANLDDILDTFAAIIALYYIPNEYPNDFRKYVDYPNLNNIRHDDRNELIKKMYLWINAILCQFKPDIQMKTDEFMSKYRLKKIQDLPSLESKLNNVLNLKYNTITPLTFHGNPNEVWTEFLNELKKSYIENFRLFLVNSGRQNVESQVSEFKKIVNKPSSIILTDYFKKILGKKEYLPGSELSPNQTTQKTNKDYEIGKIY
jgi:hypothetical protein